MLALSKIETTFSLIDKMSTPINNIINSVNRLIQVTNLLNGTTDEVFNAESLNSTASTTNRLENATQDLWQEHSIYNDQLEESNNSSSKLLGKIKGLVGAYASMQGVKKLIDLSDTVSNTNARLSMIVDDGGSVEELEKKIFSSSQRARASYLGTADAIAKLGSQTGDVFKNNDELIMFVELLNKSFVNSGTSVEGVNSVMLQLTQSLSSGKLQGEELNAILDNAQPIVQNIKDYMEEILDVDASNIKDLASEGKITAEIVKNAMFYSVNEINNKFNDMPITWEQIWNSMANRALLKLNPVLNKLKEIANSEDTQTVVNGLIVGVSILATVLAGVLDLASGVGAVLVDNWSMVAPVLATVIGLITAYNICQGAMNVANKIGNVLAYKRAKALLSNINPTLLATSNTYALAVAQAQSTVAQNGLNASMYACPIMWIVMLIIVLVGAFYFAISVYNKFTNKNISATGIIIGCWAGMQTFIWNKVIQIWNIIADLCNFIGNCMNDPVSAVKILFSDMSITCTEYVLNMVKSIEDLINKIPGVEVNITSGIEEYLNKVKETVQDIKDEAGWTEYVKKKEYIEFDDAYNKGYLAGQWIENKIKSLINPDDDDDDEFEKQQKKLEELIEGAKNYTDGLGGGDIASNTSAIADNTDTIVDELEANEENMEYLRKIATRDVIVRYVTPNINVDMSNMKNSIKNGMDIDGVVDAMVRKTSEAMLSMAEG